MEGWSGWMPFWRRPGTTRPGASYKDTPYSERRINAVRERRGPRRHLSLLELIKAESAARWSSGITLSSRWIPPALKPPSPSTLCSLPSFLLSPFSPSFHHVNTWFVRLFVRCVSRCALVTRDSLANAWSGCLSISWLLFGYTGMLRVRTVVYTRIRKMAMIGQFI